MVFLLVLIFLVLCLAVGRLRKIARNTRRPPTAFELSEKAAYRREKKYGRSVDIDPWR